MKTYHLSKSIILNPVKERDLDDLYLLRRNHSAWHVMNREQLQQQYQTKWIDNDIPSRWTICINGRIYGEIGWKSYTPGSHIYLELIIYYKELLNLDLAKHVITPFVEIMARQFRIHSIRFTVLRPDTVLEKFLGTMHVRFISARHVPARDYFPGGLMASYEVEADHLIHKYGNIKKILWKNYQFIPFKVLDTDFAPTDFKSMTSGFPGKRETREVNSRQSLADYLCSLPYDLNIRTVTTIDNGTLIKIGIAIFEAHFPEVLIWHPLMNTIEIRKILFACVLNNLRHIPVLRSGYVYKDNVERIALLKSFNFILDSRSSDGYLSYHLESVSLPDKGELTAL